MLFSASQHRRARQFELLRQSYWLSVNRWRVCTSRLFLAQQEDNGFPSIIHHKEMRQQRNEPCLMSEFLRSTISRQHHLPNMPQSFIASCKHLVCQRISWETKNTPLCCKFSKHGNTLFFETSLTWENGLQWPFFGFLMFDILPMGNHLCRETTFWWH